MLCRRTMPHSAVLARREARVEGGGHPWLRSGARRACRSDPSGRDDGSVPRRDGPHRQPTCQAAHGRLLRVRSGPLGDTSATGAVLGAYGPNASVRPANGPEPHHVLEPPAEHASPEPRTQRIQRHPIQDSGMDPDAGLMPRIQDGDRARDGNRGHGAGQR